MDIIYLLTELPHYNHFSLYMLKTCNSWGSYQSQYNLYKHLNLWHIPYEITEFVYYILMPDIAIELLPWQRVGQFVDYKMMKI